MRPVRSPIRRVRSLTRAGGGRTPRRADPVSVSRSRLALRARVRRPIHERLAPDRGTATEARQPFATVDRERPIEVAAVTVYVDVERVETRAAGGERLAEYVADVTEQPRHGRFRQR